MTDMELEDFEANGESAPMDSQEEPKGDNIEAFMRVPLNVQIVLGETKMPVSQVLNLSRGSVIELEKRIGESVDVMVNDRVVARGDLVKVADDKVGVTLTEIVKEYAVER